MQSHLINGRIDVRLFRPSQLNNCGLKAIAKKFAWPARASNWHAHIGQSKCLFDLAWVESTGSCDPKCLLGLGRSQTACGSISNQSCSQLEWHGHSAWGFRSHWHEWRCKYRQPAKPLFQPEKKAVWEMRRPNKKQSQWSKKQDPRRKKSKPTEKAI